MKKLLTIIGAFGLVTTTGTTLVACAHNRNNKAFFELNTYEIHLSIEQNDQNENTSETLEILDFAQKMKKFEEDFQEFLNHRGDIPPSNIDDYPIILELEHVSGITNLEHNWSKQTQNLIQFKSLETRGNSTWAIKLFAGRLDNIVYEVKPVYFDVIVE